MHPASQSAGANVINIASGKGGVGKTWLAITLSHALAGHGRRVLLFDGDLGLANVDIQLGLDVHGDLGGVVAGRIPLNKVITAFAEGGFDIVAGRSGSGALADLAPARLHRLQSDLWLAAQRYDRVIIDLGAGVEAGVRALTPRGGVTLVIVTDEPTSLTDAYAFIKVTLKQNPKADIRVVVNMASDRRQGERTYATLAKACKTFLKLMPPLAGIIRRDERVPEAIRRQTAFLARHPGSDTAKDVDAIAARLL
ncbi:MAG TPA: MinD/ParA family protein [Alphaproteobacteria bacterium]|nr:MinD/ParA family protein [Alphaproteobacteria bacterium]